jgi:hypothetical protein
MSSVLVNKKKQMESIPLCNIIYSEPQTVLPTIANTPTSDIYMRSKKTYYIEPQSSVLMEFDYGLEVELPIKALHNRIFLNAEVPPILQRLGLVCAPLKQTSNTSYTCKATNESTRLLMIKDRQIVLIAKFCFQMIVRPVLKLVPTSVPSHSISGPIDLTDMGPPQKKFKK